MMPVWVFACASVALGYLAHGMAMGDAPALWAACFAATAALPVGWLCSRWNWSLPGLILGVQTVQIGCHCLFAFTAPMEPAAPVHGFLSGNTMLIGHVTAGLIVAAMLRRGELVLRAAGQLLARAVPSLPRAIPLARPVYSPVIVGSKRWKTAATLPGPLPGRAPPVGRWVTVTR
jgi:hypothetical protein